MRGFSAFSIILMYLATILIDWAIEVSIKNAVRRKKLWCIVYAITSILCLGLVTAICCWKGDHSGDSLTVLMWMLYIYFSIYIPKFIYLIIYWTGSLISIGCKNHKSKLRYITQIIGLIIALVIFAAMWIGVGYTRKKIEVTSIEVSSEKLPVSFDGYRIVQFSDAHVGTWGKDTVFISNLVDSINALNPDLIVFTGDVVNRNTRELEPFRKVLSRLKAKDGVISVLGNHDYGDYMHWSSETGREENNLLLAHWEKEMGWDLLNNDYRFISNGTDSIAVIGVENWGEPPFHQYGKLKEAYQPTGDWKKDLKDGNYKLLLSHNPEHWNREVTDISNIDLTLAGHTHAMQMEFKLFGKKWSPSGLRYPYWGGLYNRELSDGSLSNLYVNIGCGDVGIPARFGSAYPEITEITLRAKSK